MIEDQLINVIDFIYSFGNLFYA